MSVWNDNLTAERANFVTHLECAMTGEPEVADQLHELSRADGLCWCAMILPGFVAQSIPQHLDHAPPIYGATVNYYLSATPETSLVLAKA